MNRRKFLAAMAAGAVITAEGLWMPGSKLISIPEKPKLYVWGDSTIEILWPDLKGYYGASIVSMAYVQEAQQRTNEIMRAFVDRCTIASTPS